MSDVESQSIPIKVTPSVANLGVTVFLNTTVHDGTSLYTTVGEDRGMYVGWVLVGTMLVTAQNVVLSARRLINNVWAADVTADTPWTLTAGDVTLTASTTPQTKFIWLLTSDSILYATNGATGPTIFSFEGFLTNNPDVWAA